MQVIRLPVNGGHWLAAYLFGLHAGAIGLLSATGLPWPVRLAAATALLWHAGFSLRRFLPRYNRRQPREVILRSDGTWRLADGNGVVEPAVLQPGALVHPRLLVLRFRCPTGPRTAVFVTGRDNADRLRRLRVRLKYVKREA